MMGTIRETAMNIPSKELDNDFGIVAKSSVKLIKNSKGLNWEVKVVAGEEHLIEKLKVVALKVHRDIFEEVKEEGE